MGVYTGTELAATTQELWDQKTADARYAASVVWKRVLNKSGPASKKGDVLHLTIKAKYTAGNVTAATGAFTAQTTTPTQVDLTLDQWRQVAIEITDRAKRQSLWSPESDFPSDAGATQGEDMDDFVLDLDSNLTSNVVNADVDKPTLFTSVEWQAALLKLDDRSVPMNNRSFFMHPAAWRQGLANEREFRDAGASGLPKSILLNAGFVGVAPGGVPPFVTTRINSTGKNNVSRVCLLLHQEALAIAVQNNGEIRKGDRTSAGFLTDFMVLHYLMGVKTHREDHGVRINIRNSNA